MFTSTKEGLQSKDRMTLKSIKTWEFDALLHMLRHLSFSHLYILKLQFGHIAPRSAANSLSALPQAALFSGVGFWFNSNAPFRSKM